MHGRAPRGRCGGALIGATMLVASACAGAPRGAAEAPPRPATADPDREACDRLCAHEAKCGDAGAGCSAACRDDVARMKPGFVSAYAGCFVAAGCEGGASRHDRCFDVALAGFARDDANQRDMAEAVCDRGERCQGLGALGRAACLQATLDPKEPDVKLGQRLVDALRRERVLAFRHCVEAAPCPGVDLHDDAVDACYAKTIAGSAS